MDTPSLVLVPPTSHSPSSSSTTTTTDSSQDRASSETTIFTIYSMYADDGPRHSWSTSALESIVDAKHPEAVLLLKAPEKSVGLLPAISISSPPAIANGAAHHHFGTHSAPSDVPSSFKNNTADPTSDTRSTMGRRQSIVQGILSTQRTISTPSGSPPSSGKASRTSSAAKPSLTSRLSAGPSLSEDESYVDTTPSSENRPRSSSSVGSVRNSGLSSMHRHSRPLIPATINLPPSRPITPVHLSPLKTPTASPSKKLGLSSPSSVTSLVPSEGEQLDSFHVRNTYAQLGVQGVKGDGYEEGVERTRARVGVSRKSQLDAELALADGNEKMRDLDPKEIQTLASLDRYGFFTIPSHDRLVLLASALLRKRLARTSAGPRNTPAQATTLTSLPPVPLPVKEASRIEKWARMLEVRTRDRGGNAETWGINASKESKLRERIYKGIPDRWRFAAWGLLMSRLANKGRAELMKLGEDYREALDKPSSYDVQIDLDVPRTISGHVMFRTRYGAGQRSLFQVLHCFSLRCTDCGYVQGMGPIAATLLCYFEPERVYASLVRLHDAYSMHAVFSPGFPGLLEAIYVQERITEQMMPDVYVAFQKHTISTTSYATKWYITLFANSVPFQTQLRLWDGFLLEGHDFFIAVAIAIVWAHRDHITCSTASFETILSLLSSFFVPEDEDALLAWIEQTLGDQKFRSSMRTWRKDWQRLVATGKNMSALL